VETEVTIMKNVKLFYQETCPHCKRALKWMEEVAQEHPDLQSVHVEMIEERKNPAIADSYDYWYVPTFFVEGRKVHEGIASKEIVERILRSAL